MVHEHISDPDSSGPAGKGTQPKRRQPTGLAAVARKLSRRTTDLLAIALVLVAGLGLGWQVIDWWLTDPADVLSHRDGLESLLGDPRTGGTEPVFLKFGTQSSLLRREAVEGTRRDARTALLGIGKRTAETARPPNRPPSEAERQLLQHLETRSPAAERPGRWRVDISDGPLQLMVATRRFAARSDDPGADSASGDRGRMVCWGLAFPAAPETWVVYSFEPARPDAAADSGPGKGASAPLDVPRPPGSRRLLAVRSPSGGTLTGFEGAGSAKSWRAFWNDWFERQGGTAVQPWSSAKTGWKASFRHPAGARIEIYLVPSGTGVWTGLIHVSPQRSGS